MALTVGQGKAPLDWLNFFLVDVRDGLGPYLAIYLLTVQKWDEASIGIVMSIAGIAAIAAQTPAGALIDNTKAKRALIIAAAVIVTACCVALPFMPAFIPVAIAQAISKLRRAPPSGLPATDRLHSPPLSAAVISHH